MMPVQVGQFPDGFSQHLFVIFDQPVTPLFEFFKMGGIALYLV